MPEAVGVVAFQEDVGMEVGRGLGTGTQAHLVVEVLRDDGVDGPDVNLAGMLPGARLHEVLDEGLQSEDDVLEALHLLQLADEHIDGALALGQLHLAVFLPEVIVLHLGIGILEHGLLATQQGLGNLVKGKVCAACGPDHNELLKEIGSLQLNKHIIDGEHPLAVVQLGELLQALHVLHPVDVAGLGDGQFAALHLIAGVGQDIDLSAEAEILPVVGCELQVVAAVAAHIDGVLDEEAVELDGILADGRGEGILEEAHIVVVDVNIGEHILQDVVEDVTRLEQVVDAHGVLSLHNAFLGTRVLAVELLRDSLVDGDGQRQLVVVLAHLHLVEQPLALLEDALLQGLGRQVVECQHDLLVVVVLVVVVLLQVGALLGGNHLLHQLNGRVVLAAVLGIAS